MEAAWFALIGFMLTVYVVLDGFDFGAGMLHLFVAKTDEERRTVLAAIGRTYAVAGKRDEALDILKRLEETPSREYVSTYDLALLALALGDKDRAFALFSKAYEDHSSFLPFIAIDARLDSVRSDPRFNELVRRMNFPAVSTVGP